LQGIETLLLPHLPPVELVAHLPYSSSENEPSGTCDDQLYLTRKMHKESTLRASVAHQMTWESVPPHTKKLKK
jgi:hypothetical protein